MTEATGWAVQQGGKIVVMSVSATQRGAIIGWLSNGGMFGGGTGASVLEEWDHATLKRAWQVQKKVHFAEMVPVTIKVRHLTDQKVIVKERMTGRDS
jgi:hypothetical protein